MVCRSHAVGGMGGVTTMGQQTTISADTDNDPDWSRRIAVMVSCRPIGQDTQLAIRLVGCGLYSLRVSRTDRRAS